MNNNSNNYGDCGTTCSECGRPWAICKQDGGCGCNKCKDIKFCEYGRMANGCIREKQPGCPMQAVIPSVTVESIEGIKNLADCLVHVSDINTTFYIDDKHRPIITWAGPIDIPGYDMEGNPNNYRDQIVTDVANQIAVIYDKSGKGYLFGLAENIDLQEQVNNKLDEMAKDGTLQEIIDAYLNANAVWGFDTVADMKASTNLIEGSFARTLGYYAKNDNGGGLYKIMTTDESADDGSLILLNSGLKAQLITEYNEINVRQFGAKGDDTTDDTVAIQKAIDYAQNNNYTLIIPVGIYLVSHLDVTNHIVIKGDDWIKSVIKSIANNQSTSIIAVVDSGLMNSVFSNFTVNGNKANNSGTNIIGVYLYGNTSQDYRTILDTIFVGQCTGDGIKTAGMNTYCVRETKFNNITFNGCDGYGLNATSSVDSFWNNLTASSCKLGGLRWSYGGNHKISNCKTWFNGEVNEADLDAERIPASAYTETKDGTPSSSKTYFTKTDTSTSPYRVPVFSVFSGEKFESGTTYYELKGDYINRGAGITLGSVSSAILSNIECQDNYGDGITLSGCHNIVISSYLADRNGLLFENNQRITYDSKNMVQYFYGVFAKNSYRVSIDMTACSTGDIKTQRGAIYDYSTRYLNANILSEKQIEPVES